jgi:hypothetical protein
MNDQFDVGSIVRAERCTKHGTRCLARAMVATKQNDTISIIWEELYPHPIIMMTSADDMRAYSSRNFLIAPKSIDREPKNDDNDDDDEVNVKIDAIQALLPFENENNNYTNTNTNTNTNKDMPNESESTLKPLMKKSAIVLWKERGDQILRLGDPSSATSYYEKALFNSSNLSIGGTIIISIEGFPRIAEVDCVEDDDGIIDVTLVSNGEERTVKISAVLFCIMERDDDLFQERILLNLTRCMLQLSELDVVNRPKYLKSAILSTTIAITISSFRQQQDDNDDDDDQSLLQANAQTALVLRVKAYSGLSKWSKATADAKRLTKNGNKQQGNKLLSSIERKKKLQLKTDKKLAKDICRLVQSATQATTTTVETTTADLNGSSRSIEKSVSSANSSYYLTNANIGRINNINTSSSSSSSSSFETKQHNNIIYAVEGSTSQDKISQFLQRLPASNLILGLCSVFILPIVAALSTSQYYQKTGQ